MKIDLFRSLRGFVLAGGSVVLIGTMLFPPFKVVDRSTGGTRHAALGHHAVWRPPTAEEGEVVLTEGFGPTVPVNLYGIEVSQNTVHFVVDFVVIVVTVFVLQLILKRLGRARALRAVRREEAPETPEAT
jgi:hypothetical protein